MKKYSLFLAVLFVLALSCGAFAAEGEWTRWEMGADAGSPIECELVEPFLVHEDNMAVLGDVTDADWVLGPEDAALTLVEYADFQCPYCSQAGLMALAFQASHPDDVRYVYRHFPLSFHEKAPMSAYAADAAGKQGFFFETEKFLYETQRQWTGLASLDEFDAWLRENIVTALPELDFDQWTADYESEEVRSTVDASFEKVANTSLIPGTPTFFANFYSVNFDPVTLEQYIALFKLQKNYKKACPAAVVEEGKEYRAVLHTDAGDIVIDLFADKAPNTVSNFISLAAEGWYDGNTFHNVIPGFVAQTGDPSGSGVGLTGYYIADENLNGDGFNEPGAVAMANTGAGKNSAQFFIAQDLDAYYRQAVAKLGEEMTEEKLAEKVGSKLDAMNGRYSVFGRVSADSLELLPEISTSTVIESIDIEVRG